jgi:hypothetical protein
VPEGLELHLEVFLILGRKERSIVFSPPEVVHACQQTSSNSLRRLMSWFQNHRNWALAWMGRILAVAHGYYARFEDRIDPFERILKAMTSASGLVLSHGPSIDGPDAMRRLSVVLRRQRLKHLVWVALDGVVSLIALILAPVLALIPGPNVFFYYPFLRLLSHYRALLGAKAGLRMVESAVEYKRLPELGRLEENLQASPVNAGVVRNVVEGLNIHGLGQFLERIV